MLTQKMSVEQAGKHYMETLQAKLQNRDDAIKASETALKAKTDEAAATAKELADLKAAYETLKADHAKAQADLAAAEKGPQSVGVKPVAAGGNAEGQSASHTEAWKKMVAGFKKEGLSPTAAVARARKEAPDVYAGMLTEAQGA